MLSEFGYHAITAFLILLMYHLSKDNVSLFNIGISAFMMILKSGLYLKLQHLVFLEILWEGRADNMNRFEKRVFNYTLHDV